MKTDIHPIYRPVVFQDTSSGDKILTRSTIQTSETIKWEDGNEYPLAKVEISSFTHPFFTGTMKIIDTAGRVERFEKRYGARKRKGTTPAPAAATADESTPASETTDTSAD
jgi:large subunit ribosomal protein L31